MVRQIVVVIGGMGLRELEMPIGIAKNWQLSEARPHRTHEKPIESNSINVQVKML